MKRLILFSFVALGLFFAGCSDQSSLVGPTQQISQTQGRQLISLPNTALAKTVTAHKSIDGSVGGTIEISADLGNNVVVSGTLNVPAGAFTGTKDINITLDNATASFQFGPSGTFDKPLTFNANISGLSLNDANNVKFAYVENNGTMQNTNNDGVGVNRTSGTISVSNARLPHFSRYGWAK